jgi:hypothetical protein
VTLEDLLALADEAAASDYGPGTEWNPSMDVAIDAFSDAFPARVCAAMVEAIVAHRRLLASLGCGDAQRIASDAARAAMADASLDVLIGEAS